MGQRIDSARAAMVQRQGQSSLFVLLSTRTEHSQQVVFVLTPHHVDVYHVTSRERIGRDTLDIHGVVSQDYYTTAFDSSRPASDSLSYSASFAAHKKKLFLLVSRTGPESEGTR